MKEAEMRIVNMSSTPEPVKIVREDQGKVVHTDFITVMPKRQVDIPDGYTLDRNWAVQHPHVRAVTVTHKEA
jgi:hypothetical protein